MRVSYLLNKSYAQLRRKRNDRHCSVKRVKDKGAYTEYETRAVSVMKQPGYMRT